MGMLDSAYNVVQIKNREAETWQCIQKHAANGVVFLSSHGVLIDEEVIIGEGTTILPGTILRGNTVVGTGCTIGPNSLLENATLGDHVVFNASQGYTCVIDSGANIGPFSHIRPDSHICENVHLGDFVEIKNATIGKGTSVSHLTYVGDADVGIGCNFGCGVAVANYDGSGKARTTVGDYAFIGCNTNLVSPVNVGEGAYTAAGSTIVEDVPPAALGIARAKQVNIANWAKEKLAPYIEKQKAKLGIR